MVTRLLDFGAIVLLSSCLAVNAFHTRTVVHSLNDQYAFVRRTTPEGDIALLLPAETESETTSSLPPVLQHIADERKNFNMNLGKAMDTLRTDMRDILTKKPDFSIYHDEISVIDPSGVQLTGLEKYKSSLQFLQTFIRFWFSPRSGLQFRMVYDFARSSIRISWNAVLIPKVPLGRPLYVDGISYYQMDVNSGKIIEHRIEDLMINNTPVAPPYGILTLLQQDLLGMRQPQSIPVGVGLGAMMVDSH